MAINKVYMASWYRLVHCEKIQAEFKTYFDQIIIPKPRAQWDAIELKEIFSHGHAVFRSP